MSEVRLEAKDDVEVTCQDHVTMALQSGIKKTCPSERERCIKEEKDS